MSAARAGSLEKLELWVSVSEGGHWGSEALSGEPCYNWVEYRQFLAPKSYERGRLLQ